MQSIGAKPTSVGGKVAYFGRSWIDDYRYVTAIRIGETLHVFGQRSPKEVYNLIAPDSLEAGLVAAPLASRCLCPSGQR
jgi:hypothetical protein